MCVLEEPRPDEERIVIIVWPAYERDPRLQQLERIDEWLVHRTWWQMRCLEIGPAILSAVLTIWINTHLAPPNRPNICDVILPFGWVCSAK
jgi:hypothetical protein